MQPMPSVIQRRNPNRSRPRKVIPLRPPLVHKVRQFAHNIDESPATVKRKIKRGEIRALPSEGAGKSRKIPTTECLRLNYIKSLDELI
jgi:hypothetical protein